MTKKPPKTEMKDTKNDTKNAKDGGKFVPKMEKIFSENGDKFFQK